MEHAHKLTNQFVPLKPAGQASADTSVIGLSMKFLIEPLISAEEHADAYSVMLGAFAAPTTPRSRALSRLPTNDLRTLHVGGRLI